MLILIYYTYYYEADVQPTQNCYLALFFLILKHCAIRMYETTAKRRQDLMKRYYFSCECFKCQDEGSDHVKSSLICPECKNCIPSNIGKCEKCQHQISNSNMRHFKNLKTRLKEILNEAPEKQQV